MTVAPEDRCMELATWRRYWPGKDPDLVCTDHAQDSIKIAEAMRFGLVIEPIGYRSDAAPPTEFPTCCCSKGHPQDVVIS